MIWGDHDPVVPVADARAVAELIPDARLEVLPAGHVPQLGHPERVAQLLVDGSPRPVRDQTSGLSGVR